MEQSVVQYVCDNLQDLVPCTLNNQENMGNAKIVENKAKKRGHIEHTSSFFNAVIGNLCHRFSWLFSVQGTRLYVINSDSKLYSIACRLLQFADVIFRWPLICLFQNLFPPNYALLLILIH